MTSWAGQKFLGIRKPHGASTTRELSMLNYGSDDTAMITAGAVAAVLVVGFMFVIAMVFLWMPPA
jgi:hypothetical protein